MLQRFTGFIGPTYALSSVNVDCQRCINLYPELDELGTGKDQEIASLVEAPGLNLLCTLPTNKCRGSLYSAVTGLLYEIYGNTLYQVNDDFTFSALGTLTTSSGQVSMAETVNRLAIVDGTTFGFFWNYTAATYTAIPFPPDVNDFTFNGCATVTTQDGYFIFFNINTNTWFISGLAGSEVADDSTINALDASAKDAAPDALVAVFSDHRNVWLFGLRTTEIWFNSGAELFPFERIDGTYNESGLAAAFSVQKLNGNVVWLGTDKNGPGIVYQSSTYTPVRISNQAVEDAIQSYSTISDATSWTYQDGGHSFYVLNFPTANATWVFDASTSQWHERAFLNQGRFERHRGEAHTFAYGKHIVGDYQNGNLYELSRNYHTDNGSPKKWLRRAPHISSTNKRQFFTTFQLDIESGVGIDGIGQGTDPQVMMRWSDDGGHKWSNEQWRSMGKIGHTKHRVKWERLGYARDRVFEVSGTDPVKVAIIGANIDLEIGAA